MSENTVANTAATVNANGNATPEQLAELAAHQAAQQAHWEKSQAKKASKAATVLTVNANTEVVETAPGVYVATEPQTAAKTADGLPSCPIPPACLDSEILARMGLAHRDAVAWYKTATDGQQELLLRTMYTVCHGPDGEQLMDYAEYVGDLNAFQDAAECLGEDYHPELAMHGINLDGTPITPTEPQAATTEPTTEGTPPAVETPAIETTEQLATKQAEAEAEREALAEAADDTLKKAGKAFRRAETEYRKGLLESGQYCSLYVKQRLQLGHPRDTAITAIAGELAKFASYVVDAAFVSRIIAAYEAHRLLCVEAKISDKQAANVPYGAYKEGWARLVERTNKDTADESWVLLPDLEDKCRAAFKKALDTSLPVTGVQRDVQQLVAEQAKLQANAADKAAKAKKAEEEAASKRFAVENAALQAKRDAEAKAQKEERDRLAEKLRLEDAAKNAKVEEERKRLEEEAKAAKLAAEAASEATRQAAVAAKAAQEAKEKAAAEVLAAQKATVEAEADAKAATKTADTAQTKADKSANKTTPKPKTPEPVSGTTPANLIGGGVDKSDSAMVAGMAAELVTGCDKPDDVLLLLLQKLAASGELSKPSTKVLNTAIGLLTAPAAKKAS